jgi:hypothetical protein
MKKLILIAFLLFPCIALAEVTREYNVAHTRHRDANMVIVVVNKSFFDESASTQEKWFTAVKACVREANLAGQTIVVAERNGRLLFYGPKSWHPFLKTIDMAWVRARINKELTCYF